MTIDELEQKAEYVATEYVDNSEPDINAEHLNKTEQKLKETVKQANDIISVLQGLIATVQSSSTTTVPASALLKATDDKIGDTSVLSGDAKNVVDAIVSLNSDMSGKAGTDILTAATIPAGMTILDSVLGMGDNVNRLFIIAPNYPSDSPYDGEFAIDIIKQRDSNRILVIAWEYGATRVYARQIFNGEWLTNWRGSTLEDVS